MTRIEWADETRNFASGCSEAGPECVNCYARGMSRRMPHLSAGSTGKLYQGVISDSGRWQGMLKWDAQLLKKHQEEICRTTTPKRWFLGSMTDLFHENHDPAMLQALAGLVRQVAQKNPKQILYLLTKRPERMLAWQRAEFPAGLPACCWPGVTLGHQVAQHSRFTWHVVDRLGAYNELDQVRVQKGGVRWVSAEPLLSPIALQLAPAAGPGLYCPVCDQEAPARQGMDCAACGNPVGIGWVIVGGESGQKARTSSLSYFEMVIQQTDEAGIPIFVKQLGAKAMLRDPKGGNMTEWPLHLQRREFPSRGES